MEYKGYDILNDNTFGMKIIKAVGRGSVPKELRGSYSTSPFAQQAIDAVISRKVEKDAKTSSSD